MTEGKREWRKPSGLAEVKELLAIAEERGSSSIACGALHDFAQAVPFPSRLEWSPQYAAHPEYEKGKAREKQAIEDFLEALAIATDIALTNLIVKWDEPHYQVNHAVGQKAFWSMVNFYHKNTHGNKLIWSTNSWTLLSLCRDYELGDSLARTAEVILQFWGDPHCQVLKEGPPQETAHVMIKRAVKMILSPWVNETVRAEKQACTWQHDQNRLYDQLQNQGIRVDAVKKWQSEAVIWACINTNLLDLLMTYPTERGLDLLRQKHAEILADHDGRLDRISGGDRTHFDHLELAASRVERALTTSHQT